MLLSSLATYNAMKRASLELPWNTSHCAFSHSYNKQGDRKVQTLQMLRVARGDYCYCLGTRHERLAPCLLVRIAQSSLDYALPLPLFCEPAHADGRNDQAGNCSQSGALLASTCLSLIDRRRHAEAC